MTHILHCITTRVPLSKTLLRIKTSQKHNNSTNLEFNWCGCISLGGLRVHQLWIKILWCNWQGRSEFTSHEKLSRAVTVLQRGRSILQESKRWVLIFLEDQLSNFHTCFCHPIALRESRT
ncbi:hypothetical protein LAZ67_X000917 [Cordylochernes scorpioides]|uniref:Uncharacterized protein n=1 Tax=Cordylochernes scorpioides TaxID=51811 RepID=A0ABY6LSA2_9ARAC|nr:hypothetical protein LAZ67_X000917 [Cordylochernes scorpioides]